MANIIIGLKSRNRNAKRGTSAIEMKEAELKANRKPYKPSKWARDVTSSIIQQTDSDGNFKPSGALIQTMEEHGALRGVQEHAKADLKEKGYKVQ